MQRPSICPTCSQDDKLIEFCRFPWRVTACTRCGWDNLREQAVESRRNMLLYFEHATKLGVPVEGLTLDETAEAFKRLTEEGDEGFFQRLCG